MSRRQATPGSAEVDDAIRLLADPAPKTRRRAAQTLAVQKDPRAVPALIAALKDPSAPVRRWAAEALRHIEAPDAFEALIAALQDEDALMRERAARALLPLRSPAAIEALVRLLRDPEGAVQLAAAGALAFMGKPAVPRLLACLEGDVGRPLDVLAQIKDPVATPSLVRLLQHEDPSVRSRAIGALAGMVDAQSIAALTTAVGSADETLRQEAAWALRHSARIQETHGPSGEVPDGNAIGRQLRDPNAQVRRAAVATLRDRGSAEPVAQLLDLVSDADDGVRTETSETLKALAGPAVVDGLVRFLGHEGAGVRETAAELIAHFATPALADARICDALVAALADTSPGVRGAAAVALGGYREARAVPALVRLVGDPESGVQDAALHALGRIGDAPAVDALLSAFEDEDSPHHGRLAWMLGQLRDPRVRNAFIDAASKGDTQAAYAGYVWIVEAGPARALPALEAALRSLGDRHDVNAPGIVACFYHCGQPRLRAAAEQWAREHRCPSFLKRASSTRWGRGGPS
jgi:HEAT repeat protein